MVSKLHSEEKVDSRKKLGERGPRSREKGKKKKAKNPGPPDAAFCPSSDPKSIPTDASKRKTPSPPLNILNPLPQHPHPILLQPLGIPPAINIRITPPPLTSNHFTARKTNPRAIPFQLAQPTQRTCFLSPRIRRGTPIPPE